MRRLLPVGFLLAVLLIFTSPASALTFSNTVDLSGVILAEGPLSSLIYPDRVRYQHDTPSDFEVPWDIVNSASLAIDAYWVDDRNDRVRVEGTQVGRLTSGGEYGFEWSWSSFSFVFVDTPSTSTFNIASTFSSWNTGDPLNVVIRANGGFGDGVLELSSSTFEIDYDNAVAPVPEPATMILMGLGLVGLAGASRKKWLKK